jgi:hypothetical protein
VFPLSERLSDPDIVEGHHSLDVSTQPKCAEFL